MVKTTVGFMQCNNATLPLHLIDNELAFSTVIKHGANELLCNKLEITWNNRAMSVICGCFTYAS